MPARRCKPGWRKAVPCHSATIHRFPHFTIYHAGQPRPPSPLRNQEPRETRAERRPKSSPGPGQPQARRAATDTSPLGSRQRPAPPARGRGPSAPGPRRSAAFGAKREAALRRPRPTPCPAGGSATYWRPHPASGPGASRLGGAAGPGAGGGRRKGGEKEGAARRGAEPPPGCSSPAGRRAALCPRGELRAASPTPAAAEQLPRPSGRQKRASRAAGGKGRWGPARSGEAGEEPRPPPAPDRAGLLKWRRPPAGSGRWGLSPALSGRGASSMPPRAVAGAASAPAPGVAEGGCPHLGGGGGDGAGAVRSGPAMGRWHCGLPLSGDGDGAGPPGEGRRR